MDVEDMLYVMEQNLQYYPEYAKLTREQKVMLALVNIRSGIAESYYSDGKLIGVGGIRHIGIGEAWIMPTTQLRRNKFFLVKMVLENFERIRNDRHLWRIFATSQISEKFLKVCGFDSIGAAHVWTRKDDTNNKT